MSYRTHHSPPRSLCSSHTGLLAVPQIFQALSRLGACTLVLPFAWNASVPHLPQLRNSKGTSLFKMESIHPDNSLLLSLVYFLLGTNHRLTNYYTLLTYFLLTDSPVKMFVPEGWNFIVCCSPPCLQHLKQCLVPAGVQ